MHDAIKAFFLVFSALFPIVDPLSASPIFLALTRNILPTTRRELSWRVTWNSFALMIGSYFLGSHLLNFLGVSLPAVLVGGGLVVCAFGWTLLMEKDGARNATPEAVESQAIFRQAFYPLTLPLDHRTGVHFGGHHGRCQRDPQLWSSFCPRAVHNDNLGG